MKSSRPERPAAAASAHRVRVALRRSLLPVATASLVACGGSDWQRPRSATDPADPSAPEAAWRPAPTPPTAAAQPPGQPAPGPAHAHHHHHPAGAEPPQPPAAAPDAAVVYVCPMHAEIVRSAPGKCPICGMTLVPKAPAAGVPGVDRKVVP